MKTTVTILSVLVALLSIAAGAAKIMLVPDETQFLGQFGFTDFLIICFGSVQVLGGILLAIPNTRRYGGFIAGAGFALSLVLILATGDWVFAAISAVPLLLAVFIIYRSIATSKLAVSEANA